MKNIVSTIIVFGSIFILIVAGAFIFDKFNGFGLIDNVDSSLNSGIKKVLESEEENIAAGKAAEKEKNVVENSYIKDNISDYNITNDNMTVDNESILNDNQTLDNNTPSDNTSDGMSI